MLRLNGLVFITCLLLIFGMGVMASGQCDPDGNDTEGDAIRIGFDAVIPGWVCPDDPHDFFSIDIPAGRVASGTITLDSPQEGTSLRISDSSDYTIYQKRTTDDTSSVVYTIPDEGADPGLYFIRAGYHTDFAFDHEYTLTIEITIEEPVRISPAEGIASGRLPSASGPESALESHVPGIIPGPIEILPTVPWPSWGCGATHRGWSTYSGPPGTASKTAEFDIPADMGMPPDSGDVFYGVLAGNDNRIYCTGATFKLIAYDITSGYLWEHPVAPLWYPYCLDGEGNIYIIEFHQTDVICLDPDGTEMWSYHCPGGGFYAELMAVGRRVYAAKQTGGDFYVDVLDRDGHLVYSAGPMSGRLHGVAEDPGAAAYFQTQFSLFQYDWDGDPTWCVNFPHSADWIDFGVTALQPMVGRDHKVWLHSPWRKRVYIYNPNGTLYHQHDYITSPELEPKTVCMGSNRMLYVGTQDNKVTCFDDWTSEVWQVQINGGFGRYDMIMGMDNKIYIHYVNIPTFAALILQHGWVSLNPDDGSQVYKTSIAMPDTFRNEGRGELAIGEDNKLIYLNWKGYVAVYSPSLHLYRPDLRIEKVKPMGTGG